MKERLAVDSFVWMEEALDRTQSISEFGDICQMLCAAMGFSCFLFGVFSSGLWRPLLTDFPAMWKKAYSEPGARYRNPVLRRAQESHKPFIWSELAVPPQSGADSLPVNVAGLESEGITASTAFRTGTGILSFALPRLPFAAESDSTFLKASTLLQLAILLDRVNELSGFQEPNVASAKSFLLSSRERECLLLSAEGFKTTAISEKLSISPSTVTFHINRCIEKFGVHSRSAAIAKALVKGEISMAGAE